MHGLYKNGQKYLKRLRRTPDDKKKRLVVVFSSMAMIFVLGFWFLYLNLTLPSLPKITNETSSTPAVTNNNQQESFFQVFGRGLEITATNVENEIQNIKNVINQYWGNFKSQIQKSNDFSLGGGQNNFRPDNSTPIPKTTLP